MPARSLIGEMEEAARRFYATVMRGEVSDANVRGYLRAASQIAEVWEQIDAQIAERVGQGEAPWEAYQRLGDALAFIRVARAYQVFVQELLAADAAADPATTGFLPRVTYDQASALAHEMQPNLQRAVAALTDSAYTPDVDLPLALGPRIEGDGACPATHLEGMLSAAREIREWAAGLIAQYAESVRKVTLAGTAAPEAITQHIERLHSRLALADSELRFGVDLVGQVTQGEATPELHEQGEDSIWAALRAYFTLNQAVALPDLLANSPLEMETPLLPAPDDDSDVASETEPHETHRSRRSGDAPKRGAGHPKITQQHYQDREIRPSDLWRVATSSARSDLRGTPFGRDEMKALCERMNGMLSSDAQRYLDTVENAEKRGDVIIIGAMSNCPFEPLYRARRPLNLCGAHIPKGHEFHWNYPADHLEQATRFDRVNEWRGSEE